MDLDKKDRLLLKHLQTNSRESLTALSKIIGLSIDSTHKRLKKLDKKGIIAQYSVFIDPKKLGFDLVVNIQVKLHNIDETELHSFLSYLKSHSYVTSLIAVLGDFDYTIVLIAKNTEQLEEISNEIRQKFRDIIANWKSVINLKVHKFEEYDIVNL